MRAWDLLHARLQYSDGVVAFQPIAWLVSLLWPRKTVLFYPEGPRPGSVDFKLCAVLGYAIVTDPRRRFDIAFKRKDATHFDPAVLQQIPAFRRRAVNAGSVDISKHTVGQAFREVFGYDLEVDPTRYEGAMVEKSDRNAAHDGRILRGPLAAADVKPPCVYQKLIDNTVSDGTMILDYRLPVHGDETPVLFRKYRLTGKRFSQENASAELAEPGVAFSQEELAGLVRLARRLGMDYGEFDVLRDRDGRLYVVDANNTPWGPPLKLSPLEKRIAVGRMARSFDRLLDRFAS